jgi:hypothetical protein
MPYSVSEAVELGQFILFAYDAYDLAKQGGDPTSVTLPSGYGLAQMSCNEGRSWRIRHVERNRS